MKTHIHMNMYWVAARGIFWRCPLEACQALSSTLEEEGISQKGLWEGN